MNKLLLLPLSIILTACATNMPVSTSDVANETMSGNTNGVVVEATEEEVVDTAEEIIANEDAEVLIDKVPEYFECEDGANVHVKYSNNGERATVKGYAPKANWNSEIRELQQDVAASGVRYTNSEDSSVKYEWHTKGNIGVLSSTWINNKTYSVNCEAVR